MDERRYPPGGPASRNPDGPAIVYTRAEWDAFLAGAKDGEVRLLKIRAGGSFTRQLGAPGRVDEPLARIMSRHQRRSAL